MGESDTDTGAFGYLTPANVGLFTDRYELSMMQGYLETGHVPRATFELFFRKLPTNRGYLVAAGLEQVVEYVRTVSFGDRALAYLGDRGFDDDFLDYLADFEFSGDVRAVPEGTPVFPNEPVLDVTAPIIEAQLFETMVINQLGFQSLVATKAARMCEVVERDGDGQSLIDFGSRRAHGTDAGVKAARAAYVGGFDGTSNEAAGELFDIPTYGTMAHSWVQSFPSEREAFDAFVDVYGERALLLVDTYDTVAGAETAMDVARDRGVDVAGVRLDSGDLVSLSKRVRAIIGDADIFVSSGLDEYEMRTFLRDGGVADGFGPGTALVTSDDAPAADGVYKLVAVERDGEFRPSMKLSAGKVTYPGPKSLRRVERDGEYRRDVLDVRGEGGEGEELLVPVIEGGQVVADSPALDEIRDRARRERQRLPRDCRRLADPTPYEVTVSDELRERTDSLQERLQRQSS